jgi:hypothetical protein
MKIKGRRPRGRQRTRWEQKVRLDFAETEGHGRKLRRSIGKAERRRCLVAR